MLDSTTNIINELRDVIWLRRMYYQRPVTMDEEELQPWPEDVDPDYNVMEVNRTNNEVEQQMNNEDDELVDANEGEIDDANAQGTLELETPPAPTTTTTTPTTTQTQSGRILCLPSYLKQNYNINLKDDEEQEMNNLVHGILLTPAEQKFYKHIKDLNEFGMFSIDTNSHELEKEYGLVGAGKGN
eukprot:2835554-Ditylum_brightwellii.AAC.1